MRPMTSTGRSRSLPGPPQREQSDHSGSRVEDRDRMDVVLSHRGNELADILVLVANEHLGTHELADTGGGRIPSRLLEAAPEIGLLQHPVDLPVAADDEKAEVQRI